MTELDPLSQFHQDLAAVWQHHRPTWSYIRPEWRYADVTGAARPTEDPKIYRLDDPDERIVISNVETKQREYLDIIVRYLFNYGSTAFCTHLRPGCTEVESGWTGLSPIEIIDQFVASSPHTYCLPYPFLRPANLSKVGYIHLSGILSLFQQTEA